MEAALVLVFTAPIVRLAEMLDWDSDSEMVAARTPPRKRAAAHTPPRKRTQVLVDQEPTKRAKVSNKKPATHTLDDTPVLELLESTPNDYKR